MAHVPLYSEPSGAGISPEPKVGDMLGVYRLDFVAGEGGMGRVFCATHTKLNKRVAIKVLQRRYARRPEAIARFFQEARSVNVIRHPNIVEITDFVEGEPGGDSYYIMEWLDGTTLATRLQRQPLLPLATVVDVARQVASTLAAVHKAGFVHRDLKPDNVFVVERSGVLVCKLLDFGVASLQGAADGNVAGTAAYLSPEGAAGRALDGRSDIYSLGVMLYELVAGALPFEAATLSEYVMKHMTVAPRPVAEAAPRPVPLTLAQTIERCLSKRPEDRFQSMDELADMLATLVVDEVEIATTARGRVAARWRLVALVVAVAGGVTGVALVTVHLLRKPVPPPAPIVEAFPRPLPAAVIPVAPPAPIESAEDPRVEIDVASEPPGAEVYEENGVILGTTPCKLHLPRGAHALELRLAGYRSTSLAADVVAGVPNPTYSVHLQPAPAAPSSTHHHSHTSAGKGGSVDDTINPFKDQ